MVKQRGTMPGQRMHEWWLHHTSPGRIASLSPSSSFWAPEPPGSYVLQAPHLLEALQGEEGEHLEELDDVGVGNAAQQVLVELEGGQLVCSHAQASVAMHCTEGLDTPTAFQIAAQQALVELKGRHSIPMASSLVLVEIALSAITPWQHEYCF